MERSPLRPRPTVTWGAVTCGAVTCGAVTCGAVTCTGPAGQSRRCQALHGHGPQRRDGLHSIRALLDRDLDLATVLQAQLQVTDVHLRQLQRRAAVLRLALDDPSDAMILRLPTLSRLEAQERDDVFGGSGTGCSTAPRATRPSTPASEPSPSPNSPRRRPGGVDRVAGAGRPRHGRLVPGAVPAVGHLAARGSRRSHRRPPPHGRHPEGHRSGVRSRPRPADPLSSTPGWRATRPPSAGTTTPPSGPGSWHATTSSPTPGSNGSGPWSATSTAAPPHPTEANTAAPSRDFAMRSAARSRTFPLMARGTLRVAHRQCCRSYGPSAEGVMSTDRELLVEQERLQGKQPRCAPTSRSMSASSGSARSCSSVAPPSG
jgi:hypothetical protein